MYLNAHTYHSLRYGTLSAEELVKIAVQKKIDCLVLTDINNTSCAYDFVRECMKENIRPVLGIEFRNTEGKLLYIGIAKNNKGFYELNNFFTKHSLGGISLPDRAPIFEEVYVLYRSHQIAPKKLRENEFIGIAPYELPKLYTSRLKEYMEKLVMLNTVTFANQKGYETHCLLRAIDQNTLLSKLDYETVAHKSELFYTREELLKKYEAFPEIISNTDKLIADCEIHLNLESNKNRKYYTGNKETDIKLLEKLAYSGFKYRYQEDDKEAMTRLKKELRIIAELNFLSYFLITYDIIVYAHSKGYHHIGRGSGANSIVAYCLKITDVDPMELDLYFERFINPHRHSPPDFDIDFCWDERDDVIDYIFKRFGADHVGLLATYATFGGASIIRELGKVFGLTKNDIDVIADEPKQTHKHHPLAKKIFEYGERIDGFPNHLGIHAGGIIITDDPINNHTALQMMQKGFPIVQFDMNVAEENGFFKFDMLSQRGLGHIKEAVNLIKKNRQVNIDIHRVADFKKDEKIKEQLSKAKTIGCFYIESPAMRGLITKLRCKDFITLVAASSIIRPGVAKSGMMREYIRRFQNPDKIEYLHPKFKELLEETFGVMVYQEDVIKIAHYFAGIDLAEADILRRTMSGKNRAQKTLVKIRETFFSNCRSYGYEDTLTEEVWRQIESFSGFSFCKAHSASYAVESYQSLFLKTYYPLEFMVAVINNFGGFYDRELYVHEARMAGATIEAPCINNSEYTTTIYGTTIYLGFIHLKDLEEKTAKKIIKERKQNGVYLSMEDFIQRTDITREQLILLIRIGALRFTGSTKQELLWQKNNYLKPKKERTHNPVLFNEPIKTYTLPGLEIHSLEEVYEQIDLLGFPLVSPFDLLKTDFRGEIMAEQLKRYEGKKVKMVGYFVAKKQVRTSDHRMMNFGTWVDYEGNFFDSTHFPDSAEKYPFRGKGCYLILGKVVTDFGFPSLEVEKMAKLEMKNIE
jgi:DNA-directed DNA polymerase III PolC